MTETAYHQITNTYRHTSRTHNIMYICNVARVVLFIDKGIVERRCETNEIMSRKNILQQSCNCNKPMILK